MVKYLRLFGWEPIVVTVDVEGNTDEGHQYFDELPDDMEVIRIPWVAPSDQVNIDFAVKRLTGLLSGTALDMFKSKYDKNNQQDNVELCSFPDSAIFWAYQVSSVLEKTLDTTRFDIIYSTSGPLSNHIAGYFIKQRFQKLWIADFRDEWSNNPMVSKDKGSLNYLMILDVEQRILEYADEVICVTEHSYDNYSKLGVPADKLTCITNGYDEEDFEGIDTGANNNDKFTIVHNGVLYFDRTPVPILKAIKNLIDSKEIDSGKITFHIGSIKDDKLEAETRKSISELKLEHIAFIVPYMEHRACLELTANADILISITGPAAGNSATYPAKIFEYLRFKKPILSFGPPDSVMEEFLHKTNCGVNIQHHDIPAIESELLRLYTDWLNGKSVRYVEHFDMTVYERKSTTKKHAEVFDRAKNRAISQGL